MEIIITNHSKIRKTDAGIEVDGELKVIKEFLLYLILYVDNLSTKQQAEKIYNKKSAKELLINYVAKIYSNK